VLIPREADIQGQSLWALGLGVLVTQECLLPATITIAICILCRAKHDNLLLREPARRLQVWQLD
jgi:hypothetical protein